MCKGIVLAVSVLVSESNFSQSAWPSALVLGYEHLGCGLFDLSRKC
jgi:hypothetical protein